jgi:hypothetical protein
MDIVVGSLNPGATYIYERVDNRVYAREMGQTKRRLVGWTDDSSVSMREYTSEINSVLRMCETDPAMRELLDKLFVLYNLKKQHE